MLCKSAFRVCVGGWVEGKGEGKTSQERVWNPKDKIKRIQAQIFRRCKCIVGGAPCLVWVHPNLAQLSDTDMRCYL